jgi:SAM-dependent methyltransferase
VIADVIEGVPYERREQPGCLLCGRTHAARTIAAGFGMTAMVAECVDCRLAYQSPRPSLEASLAYMNMRWRSQDAYVADAECQRGRVRKHIDLLAPIIASQPRVLDFGAGIGTFVKAAREQGWDAIGVERSRSALERASRQNAIELESDLANVGYDFDVITLWDVVEHLRDPRGTIVSLLAHLRPNGWMIFETGNWESWNRLAMGDAWSLYLFDHQYYFSPSSLRALVTGAGLTDFRLLPASQSTPPPAPAEGDGDDASARWRAYQRGIALWPDHADVDIMVAAARQPTYAELP